MMQRKTGNGYIKKIDFVFFHEGVIREAVQAARADTPHSGKNGSGLSDPTAVQAIRNVTPLHFVSINGEKLEWPEHWLKVIDATFAWCDSDRLIVAKDRYSGVDYRVTVEKLIVSQATYFNLLDNVRQHAALCAAQLGLIKVC